MATGLIGPTVGVGLRVYDLAKKQGWLDALFRRIRGVEHVLVLGSTGTGKSQFLSSLHVELPQAIDEMHRTQKMQVEELKYNGSFFDFIDTPGEVAKRARRQEAFTKFVAFDKPGGIINVVSNGFHEYSKGRDLQPLTAHGRPSKRFLESHLESEIKALEEWVPLVASPETTSWVMTVVTKSDLWWREREKVVAHYESGPYGSAIAPLSWLSPTVVTYSSLRHKFYGTSQLDGSFDDHDLAKGRANMLAALLELASRNS